MSLVFKSYQDPGSDPKNLQQQRDIVNTASMAPAPRLDWGRQGVPWGSVKILMARSL